MFLDIFYLWLKYCYLDKTKFHCTIYDFLELYFYDVDPSTAAMQMQLESRTSWYLTHNYSYYSNYISKNTNNASIFRSPQVC